MLICGTNSFSHVDDDLPSSPKPSTRKKHSNKNPYSSRGLDKFSSVLAELEARRQKIMQSPGVAMVRFVYDNSQDWVPIIVRPKPDQQKQLEPPPPPPPPPPMMVKEISKTASKKKGLNEIVSWKYLKGWCCNYWWGVGMVLMLLCLVVFGRVFAICCTSIWWYMVPSIKEWSHDDDDDDQMMRKSRVVKRKEYGRRLSDKRLLGANNLVGNLNATNSSHQGKKIELASPRGHGKRR